MGGFFSDEGTDRHSHSAHSNGAESGGVDLPDDRLLGRADAHNSGPRVFDFVWSIWEDCSLEKFFELVLDEGCGFEFGGCFGLEIEIAAPAEEDAVVDVAEIIVASVEVESALERKTWYWFGDEDLSAGGFDI